MKKSEEVVKKKVSERKRSGKHIKNYEKRGRESDRKNQGIRMN